MQQLASVCGPSRPRQKPGTGPAGLPAQSRPRLPIPHSWHTLAGGRRGAIVAVLVADGDALTRKFCQSSTDGGAMLHRRSRGWPAHTRMPASCHSTLPDADHQRMGCLLVTEAVACRFCYPRTRYNTFTRNSSKHSQPARKACMSASYASLARQHILPALCSRPGRPLFGKTAPCTDDILVRLVRGRAAAGQLAAPHIAR